MVASLLILSYALSLVDGDGECWPNWKLPSAPCKRQAGVCWRQWDAWNQQNFVGVWMTTRPVSDTVTVR